MITKILELFKSSVATLRTGQDLKHRAARGSVWLATGSGTEQALRLLRNVILARLLAPQDFGMMAIILAINMAFETFTEIGIQYAIVQNPKGQEQTYLNGAWWLAVVRALGLYALAFLAAPWVAQFYGNPGLVPLMRVALLTILLNGIFSPRAHVALKQMNFKRWAMLQNGGGICGILTAVLLALLMPGVWALVLGFVTEATARCLLSHLLCPFKPGFHFDRESLQALLQYSRGMFGLPILSFVFTQADIFVVAKLFPSAEVGIYSLAVSLAQTPFGLFGPLVGQVVGPVFSQIQSEYERANKIILAITSVVALVGLPLLFCGALYGGSLLRVLYGGSYARASLPFALAFGTAMLQIVSVPVVSFYFMTGRPSLHRFFTLIRVALIIILIYPAVRWFGPAGATGAALVSMAVAFIFQIGRLRQITNLGLWQYARVFLPPLAGSVCVLVVWVATHKLFPSQPVANLLLAAIGCLLAYMFALGVFLKSSKHLPSSWLVQWRQS
jgi:PST family polysaccharide transporter/lipopolysaccharide exporter